MSHYFLGEWDQARTQLAALAKLRGALEGGKGSYWLARIDERLDHKDAAIAGYRETVTKYPFSWYALLARARLAALGVDDRPVRRRRRQAARPEARRRPSTKRSRPTT